jgi:hypothetical protein
MLPESAGRRNEPSPGDAIAVPVYDASKVRGALRGWVRWVGIPRQRQIVMESPSRICTSFRSRLRSASLSMLRGHLSLDQGATDSKHYEWHFNTVSTRNRTLRFCQAQMSGFGRSLMLDPMSRGSPAPWGRCLVVSPVVELEGENRRSTLWMEAARYLWPNRMHLPLQTHPLRARGARDRFYRRPPVWPSVQGPWR